MSLLQEGGSGDTINLSFRSLSNIPDDVWQAFQLKKLVLAGNPLTSLPPQLSRLTNLQTLNCGSSELKSFPSAALPHLPNLTYLNLSENQIAEIPENIGVLTSLTDLIFSANPITRVPASLGDLQALSVLKLSKCKLTELPQAVVRLKNLKELQLADNQITGPIPTSIFHLPKLEILDMSYNKIDSLLNEELSTCSEDELDANFSSLSKLRVLTLNDNKLTTIPPHTLSNCTSLEVLQLSFNKIETMAADIAKIQSLVMLDLSSNRISKLPSEWSELINLGSFDVSYNDLTEIPATYENLMSLKVFTVVGNNFELLPTVCQILIDKGTRVRFNDANSLPNHILPGLYLGGVSAARDKYTLKRLGVNHVLTVAEIDPLYAEEFVYKVVRVDDHADQDLTAFFEECRQFIYDGIQAGGVLVHCAAGVSRSATMVIMYVMTVERLSMEEAFEFVRGKRPIICPNSGFRDQLLTYENELMRKEGKEKCIVS